MLGEVLTLLIDWVKDAGLLDIPFNLHCWTSKFGVDLPRMELSNDRRNHPMDRYADKGCMNWESCSELPCGSHRIRK